MGTGNAGGSQSVGPGPGDDPRRFAREEGSQKETGGSGGEQLTRSLEDTGSAEPMMPVDAGMNNKLPEPEGAGTAATAAQRGPQDTHSNQAGGPPNRRQPVGIRLPERVIPAGPGPADPAPFSSSLLPRRVSLRSLCQSNKPPHMGNSLYDWKHMKTKTAVTLKRITIAVVRPGARLSRATQN